MKKMSLLILAMLFAWPNFASTESYITRNSRLIIGKNIFMPRDSVIITDKTKTSEEAAMKAYVNGPTLTSTTSKHYVAPRSEYYRIINQTEMTWAVYNPRDKTVSSIIIKGTAAKQTNWLIIALVLAGIIVPITIAAYSKKIYRPRFRPVAFLLNLLLSFLGLFIFCLFFDFVFSNLGIEKGLQVGFFALITAIFLWIFSIQSLMTKDVSKGDDQAPLGFLIFSLLTTIAAVECLTSSLGDTFVFSVASVVILKLGFIFFKRYTRRKKTLIIA